MILSEVFGENVWVIPTGKNLLTLIELPESKDQPIFGMVKNREDFGLLMAYLVPNVQFGMNQVVPVLNMLYRVGKYKTRAELFKLIAAKPQKINDFTLIMYKAAAFAGEGMKEESEKLFKDQLICEMSEAWAQKQMLNLELRFAELFDFIQAQKEKEAPKVSSILIN